MFQERINSGQDWTDIACSPAGQVLSAVAIPYASYQAIELTRAGTSNWVASPTGLFGISYEDTIHSINASPVNGLTAMTCIETNGGASWSAPVIIATNSAQAYADVDIAASPAFPCRVALLCWQPGTLRRSIAYSTDRGATWTLYPLPGDGGHLAFDANGVLYVFYAQSPITGDGYTHLSISYPFRGTMVVIK